MVADDDAFSRRLLEATLVKGGYDVSVSPDGVEAWRALQGTDTPLLAILDWEMPGMDGLEVCRRVRQRAQEPYIYIILLTGRGQKEDIIEGLEAGADDFLTKPFHPDELRARLRVGERILGLQAELIAAREALRMQATHDVLTGLFNRAAIFDILERELARRYREGMTLSIIMADLDGFKQINDTYGHQAGDAVLREVARRMHASLRSYDAIGRYGGEEFLIVLPRCDISQAMDLAERVRAQVSREAMDISQGYVQVTSSIGVAASGGASEVDTDSLIHAADKALYRAKHKGRNRVELATAADVIASSPHE